MVPNRPRSYAPCTQVWANVRYYYAAGDVQGKRLSLCVLRLPNNTQLLSSTCAFSDPTKLGKYERMSSEDRSLVHSSSFEGRVDYLSERYSSQI